MAVSDKFRLLLSRGLVLSLLVPPAAGADAQTRARRVAERLETTSVALQLSVENVVLFARHGCASAARVRRHTSHHHTRTHVRARAHTACYSC